MKNNRHFLTFLILTLIPLTIYTDDAQIAKFKSKTDRTEQVITYTDYSQIKPKIPKNEQIQQIAVIESFEKIEPKNRNLRQNFLQRKFLFKNKEQQNNFLIKNNIYDFGEKKEERVLLELVTAINPHLNLLRKKKRNFFGSII